MEMEKPTIKFGFLAHIQEILMFKAQTQLLN